MSKVVKFWLYSRKSRPKLKPGTFEVIGPDGEKSFGVHTSFAASLPDIAMDYPLDTMITFQWDYSQHDSGLPLSLRDWMRATYALRGLTKEQSPAEIERFEERHRVGAW